MDLDPLRSGFGARDGSGSDPGENSVKKISTHFLNGICSWIWTPGEWIWSPSLMGGGRIQGKNSVKKISTHLLNGICGWIWTP